uniref:Uncharacterized protein n=1 Tax=Avena sativa TaxID=4498 RepID=A0ACD5Z916_AVESA
MSCEDSETAANLLRPLSPAAKPLEDDNLLSEILLRLPPLPSSLPRASAVCSRWRALVSDPRFIRRFHLRHRGSPPLLGFFDTQPRGTCVTFVPALQAPNCVPTERLSLQIGNYEKLTLVLDCRHGLHVTRNQALVWDPATGDQHRADLPPEFDRKILHGAVIRAATNIHHFQFQMVLLRRNQLQSQQVIARVYSSETGVWVILSQLRFQIFP